MLTLHKLDDNKDFVYRNNIYLGDLVHLGAGKYFTFFDTSRVDTPQQTFDSRAAALKHFETANYINTSWRT